jgi:ABC-type multidrug transport system permease subunit
MGGLFGVEFGLGVEGRGWERISWGTFGAGLEAILLLGGFTFSFLAFFCGGDETRSSTICVLRFFGLVYVAMMSAELDVGVVVVLKRT